MFDGEKNVESVLQILAYKKVNADANNTQERYRFIMSDGEKTHSACLMIGSALVDRVEKGEFERFTIIRVKSYQINKVNNNVIIIMNDPTVIRPGKDVATKLGSPSAINAGSSSQVSNSPAKRTANNNNNTPLEGATAPKKSNNVTPFSGRNMTLDDHVANVVNIHSFAKSWTIKGRVTNKSNIRRFSNQRGEGCLFSVEVEDGTGKIRITLFGQKAEMYHPLLEVNKIYIFAKFGAKTANRQYNKLSCEYELNSNDDSIIEERDEDVSMPQIKYNFVPIAKMTDYPGGNDVDVAAVVRSVGEVSTIVAKASQKELKKREVIIADESGAEISLTLWNKEAEECTWNEGTVIILKNARVSEYNSRSLSTSFDGTTLVNPDMDITRRLQSWYASSNKGSFNSMTTAGGKGDSTIKLLIQGEAEAENNPNGIYLTAKVTVITVGKLKSYEACPHEACKKKLMDMNNGYFRCSNPTCPSGGAEMDNPSTRYIQGFQVADVTGAVWVSVFHDEFVKFLGMKEQEIKGLSEDQLEKLLNEKTSFQSFNMRLKFKQEFYKDELKVKASVMKMNHLDWNSYGQSLVKMAAEFNQVL
jgi:replication factor A1